MSSPYPVEPTYPVLDRCCGATSLYQRTLPCLGAIGGQSAYLWRLALRKTTVGRPERATAAATSRPDIERVHSPCGASVYRLWFPTRRVRGQHGQPAWSAMFSGCGPCRPVAASMPALRSDDALWWRPYEESNLAAKRIDKSAAIQSGATTKHRPEAPRLLRAPDAGPSCLFRAGARMRFGPRARELSQWSRTLTTAFSYSIGIRPKTFGRTANRASAIGGNRASEQGE